MSKHKNEQCTIYVLADCPTIDIQGELRGLCMKAKRDYLDQVHSDQMVLETRSLVGMAQRRKQWSIATKGGPSGSSALRSDNL
jgi:hypothetical protein